MLYIYELYNSFIEKKLNARRMKDREELFEKTCESQNSIVECLAQRNRGSSNHRGATHSFEKSIGAIVSSALETNLTNRKDRQRDRNRSRLEAIKRWYSTAGAFDCNSRTPYGRRGVESRCTMCTRLN